MTVPRYAIERNQDTLILTIPSRKSCWSTTFWGCLLAWMTVGGGLTLVVLVLLPALLLSTEMPRDAKLVGWGEWFLGVCSIVTLPVIILSNFRWRVAGKEIIAIDAQSLTVSRKGLFNRSKHYKTQQVANLRVSPLPVIRRPQRPSLWGISEGAIAFDYQGQTYHFGKELSLAEAHQLLPEIESMFVQLHPKAGRNH